MQFSIKFHPVELEEVLSFCSKFTEVTNYCCRWPTSLLEAAPSIRLRKQQESEKTKAVLNQIYQLSLTENYRDQGEVHSTFFKFKIWKCAASICSDTIIELPNIDRQPREKSMLSSHASGEKLDHNKIH